MLYFSGIYFPAWHLYSWSFFREMENNRSWMCQGVGNMQGEKCSSGKCPRWEKSRCENVQLGNVLVRKVIDFHNQFSSRSMVSSLLGNDLLESTWKCLLDDRVYLKMISSYNLSMKYCNSCQSRGGGRRGHDVATIGLLKVQNIDLNIDETWMFNLFEIHFPTWKFEIKCPTLDK